MRISHYLQRLLVNQEDQEKIAQTRREKSKERSEERHKFNDVHRAVKLETKRGHIPNHVLNKKILTWLLLF